MALTIRPMRTSDRDAWEKLYVAYLEFYESGPIASSTDLLWHRITQVEPEIQGLVAEDDGVVVGIVHFHYQLSSWTHTWHCYLEDLFVEPAYRSQGAGRSLINAVKQSALAMKCSELFWITRASNENARKLYDQIATPSDFVRYEIMLEDNK